MIEDWIDNLAGVWAISLNDFKTVRSIRIIEGADFPKSINPGDDFPLAMTLVTGLSPLIAASGTTLHWSGITEFHIAPSLELAVMPSLPKWFGLIMVAAAAHKTLSGTVTDFSIPDEPEAITLRPLQYGAETEHWGFSVRWRVLEPIVLTVTA